MVPGCLVVLFLPPFGQPRGLRTVNVPSVSVSAPALSLADRSYGGAILPVFSVFTACFVFLFDPDFPACVSPPRVGAPSLLKPLFGFPPIVVVSAFFSFPPPFLSALKEPGFPHAPFNFENESPTFSFLDSSRCAWLSPLSVPLGPYPLSRHSNIVCCMLCFFFSSSASFWNQSRRTSSLPLKRPFLSLFLFPPFFFF